MALNAKRVVEIIVKATDKTGPVFTNIKDSLKETFTSTKGLATVAVVVGAAFVGMAKKIVAAYGEAIQAAGGFQKRVLEVNTLLNKSDSEVTQMSRALQDMAVKYGQVDEVMAQAQYNVASAGFADVAESLEILDVASRAAIGGLTDVNTAASLITQTLNAYGMQASDAEKVAGTLFATIKQGVTTFSQLAGTLGAVTSTAATAGVSFEETAAAVAVLTQKGVLSAEATTALNALILALGASSGDTKDKLEDLGITLDDGLGGALQAVSEASGDTLAGIAELVPNIRAIRGAAVLAVDGGQRFTDVMKSMADGVKDFNNAYQIMSKAYDQAVARNEAAHKRLKQAVGETGLEGASAALRGMAEGANAQAKAMEDTRDVWQSVTRPAGELWGWLNKINGQFEAGVIRVAAAAFEYHRFGGVVVKATAEAKKAVQEFQKVEQDWLMNRPDPSTLGPFSNERVTELEAQAKRAENALAEAAANFGIAMTKMEFDPDKAQWIEVDKTADEIADELEAAYKAAVDRLKSRPAPVIERDVSFVAPEGDTGDTLQLYEDLMALEQDRADMLMGYYGDDEGERLVNINGFMTPEQIAAVDAEYKKHMDNIQKISDRHKFIGDAIEDVGNQVERLTADSLSAFLAGSQGAIMFGRMLREVVLSALTAVIVKLTIIKALKSALGFIGFEEGGKVPEQKYGGEVPAYAAGGAVAAPAAPAAVMFPRFASGGMIPPGIPQAMFGYTVPDTGGAPRGQDSVLIAASPGEQVIDRSLSANLRRFLTTWEAQSYFPPSQIADGGGRSVIEVHMDVARPVGVLDALSYGEAATAAAKKIAEARM